MESCLQLVSATDRTTKVVLVEDHSIATGGALLRTLARRANLILVHTDATGAASLVEAKAEAIRTLQDGHLLAIGMDNAAHADALAGLVQQLRAEIGAPLLPAYCGSLDEGVAGVTPRVRVVFGEIASGAMSMDECRKAIGDLGDWIRQNDDVAGGGHH